MIICQYFLNIINITKTINLIFYILILIDFFKFVLIYIYHEFVSLMSTMQEATKDWKSCVMLKNTCLEYCRGEEVHWSQVIVLCWEGS